jgi:imidazolonepropionase-like amidohydrolase
MHLFFRPVLLLPALLLPLTAGAQTAPPEGLRSHTPSVHAFVNARIVQAPGRVIEQGTLVIRDGIIRSVGRAAPPRDAVIHDLAGMTLYPAFLDAGTGYGIPRPPQEPRDEGRREESRPHPRTGVQHWNLQIQAQQQAEDQFEPDPKAAEQLRSQGFAAALAAPARGILRGTSALVSLGAGAPGMQVIRTGVAQHMSFERDGTAEGYPVSQMGVIALLRQTFLDAAWYRETRERAAGNAALPRPETNAALEALGPVVAGTMLLIADAGDELSILRAAALGREFRLNLLIRGSGHEFLRLDEVRATGRPLVVPVNFPDVPAVETPEDAHQVSLRELQYWHEAPENPARLQRAGITFALTSAGLKDPARFLDRVRTAVERGLSADAALAALTTTPATLLGAADRLGTLEPGRIANILVVEGDLFRTNGVIRETWVDGTQYEVKTLPAEDPRGSWTLRLPGLPERTLTITGEPDRLKGSIGEGRGIQLRSPRLSARRLSFAVPGDSLGTPGIIRLSGIVEASMLRGTGEWPDGSAFVWSAARAGAPTAVADSVTPAPPQPLRLPATLPYGEFGRTAPPEQPAAVLVRGATIWTSGPAGVIPGGDLLVEKGRIRAVGTGLTAPAGAVIVDGRGKHVTAGLIDAHSHMGVSGNVNEGTQAVTCEVRIGDVVNPDDIDIYRALAGGLTMIHVLHGSANPIGGQSQLLKLRWGATMEGMKYEHAFPTVKFALGENVKQSNWGERFTTRYPQTRMGVEQIIRDAFVAAREYTAARERYLREKSGPPPRRDLELEALAEILAGTRDIHCHAYRQDEILMLMRLAEELGFRVAVFQHILEGYKVADVMARHGAAGSSFSDWWAFKLEVYDAIPYNGAIMHDQGVLVSFNSDSDEMARRMNLEAAKAVKYGGLSETDALNLVTINAATQLRIDRHTGSLEPGKEADFVVWSGHPLSTLAACEQTWVDGRRYFEREEDRMFQTEITRQRGLLIQQALSARRGGAPAAAPGDRGLERFREEFPYSCHEEEQP